MPRAELQVLVATKPVDFRKYAACAIMQSALEAETMSCRLIAKALSDPFFYRCTNFGLMPRRPANYAYRWPNMEQTCPANAFS